MSYGRWNGADVGDDDDLLPQRQEDRDRSAHRRQSRSADGEAKHEREDNSHDVTREDGEEIPDAIPLPLPRGRDTANARSDHNRRRRSTSRSRSRRRRSNSRSRRRSRSREDDRSDHRHGERRHRHRRHASRSRSRSPRYSDRTSRDIAPPREETHDAPDRMQFWGGDDAPPMRVASNRVDDRGSGGSRGGLDRGGGDNDHYRHATGTGAGPVAVVATTNVPAKPRARLLPAGLRAAVGSAASAIEAERLRLTGGAAAADSSRGTSGTALASARTDAHDGSAARGSLPDGGNGRPAESDDDRAIRTAAESRRRRRLNSEADEESGGRSHAIAARPDSAVRSDSGHTVGVADHPYYGQHQGAASTLQEDSDGGVEPAESAVSGNGDVGSSSPPPPPPAAAASIAVQRYNALLHGCRSVNAYRPLRKIDEGTYGVVFAAEDIETGERVALKKVKMGKLSANDGFPITALRETNVLLMLRHPNIVGVREMVVGSTLDKVRQSVSLWGHSASRWRHDD